MFVVFSHILAFAVLFVDSLFDLFNDHNVPDEFAVTGIIGGLLLHAAQSYTTGSMTAITVCLIGGLVAGIYGWAAYYKGFWGGADAMILTMMGFTVPLTATGQASVTYILDLVFNFMIAAVAVTLIYAAKKFIEAEGSLREFQKSLKKRQRFIAAFITGTGLFSVFLWSNNVNGAVFFAVMTSLIFLYEWVKLVEDRYLVREIKTEDAFNEVPAPDQGFDGKIKGLTEEEIEEYEEDTIKVRTGVPLVPVFLLSVVITDLTGLGVAAFYTIY
ncbi:hypothetical protein ACK3SF_02340 [Candidatus Nanosalina sp. VS9-1]|uniref:hypothetical protein n=1 Tax=Candidatus Nanosalina sp. VS9-1 TaxID=3388566 RepID=UPI0039E18AF0